MANLRHDKSPAHDERRLSYYRRDATDAARILLIVVIGVLVVLAAIVVTALYVKRAYGWDL